MDNFDKERDRAIYRFILNCFALITDDQGAINFRQTAKRLGKDNADFAIRVYKEVQGIEQKYGAAKLTTGKLVELLAGLTKGLEQSISQDRLKFKDIGQLANFITPADIISLFQILTRLSPAEKEALRLYHQVDEILLQQAFINLSIYNDRLSREKILEFYKTSLGRENHQKILEKNTFTEIELLIKETVEEVLELKAIPRRLREYQAEYFINKVIRAINKIKAQAGVKEAATINPSFFQKFTSRYEAKYFTQDLIKKITRTVIENEILNFEFPIFIKYITIKKMAPLPLFAEGTPQTQEKYLLNQEICQIEDQDIFQDNTDTESHEAYEVTVYLQIKINDLNPKNYKKLYQNGKAYEQLTAEGEKWINFSMQSRGVSGRLSQIIQSINRGLLSDIEALKDYFSVAHDVIINQEIIGNSVASPVWSHKLVRLCKVSYIKEALEKCFAQEKVVLYEDVAFLDELGRGDFFSFDFVEATAKSALQARLRAIKNTGINPQNYLIDLCHRGERIEELKIAKSYLISYPFSLKVMESHLKNTLLMEMQDELNLNPSKRLPSLIHYLAYLELIENYLNEGLYYKAKIELDEISKRQIEELSKQGVNLFNKKFKLNEYNVEKNHEIEIFSGSLLAKYEFCRALYYYLYDDNITDKSKESMDIFTRRKNYILEAWSALKNAEIHLQIRIAKYYLIGEISQSTLYPHYLLLSKIYFLKSKLFLFFPKQIESIADIIDSNEFIKNIDFARIYLLEKTRIYAARNGETELYSVYTAYQVWAYLMAGYLVNDNLVVKDKKVELNRSKCFEWAKKLLNDALNAYAETGKNSYESIKKNSGKIDEKTELKPIFEQYGSQNELIEIQTLPPIVERNLYDLDIDLLDGVREKMQAYQDNILNLDMSLLKIENLEGKSIYLFGNNACVLLFVRGIYHLCNDNWYEFSEKEIENLTNDIDKWKRKIFRAYRLFSFAWGIAEDGCIFDENNKRLLRSDFENKNDISRDEYSPEVNSVRDIYPHRTTEIADLGKAYAAVCNILLMYLTSSKYDYLKNEAQQLIDSKIHYIFRLKKSFVQEELGNQNRYNGHLELYFNRVKAIINQSTNELEERKQQNNLPIDNLEEFKKIRDKILIDLFKSFYENLKEY